MSTIRRLVTTVLLGLGLFFGLQRPAAAQPVAPAPVSAATVSEAAARDVIIIIIETPDAIYIIIISTESAD